MRILFMGTPDFAAVTLEKLLQSKHEVIGVVTQPDKQKGRGQSLSCSAVKELAFRHNLNIYQPVKIKEPEFLETVKEMNPDAIIVSAFGQFLPKALLDIPVQGCINVHGSLLPKYRGAAPIQYAVIDGEKETGITIMYMGVGIDTGDMILQRSIPIAADETGGSLFDKMAVLGGELLIEALEQIEAGTAARIPQDNEKATYVRVIDKEMGRLDFNLSAVKLERLIRGLNPWPSAFTVLDGKILKLWQAEVQAEKPWEQNEVPTPGEIVELRKDSFVVATGEDFLVLKEVQLEGKKRLPVDAFLRGYPVKLGTILG